jgi:hypothetical protein
VSEIVRHSNGGRNYQGVNRKDDSDENDSEDDNKRTPNRRLLNGTLVKFKPSSPADLRIVWTQIKDGYDHIRKVLR